MQSNPMRLAVIFTLVGWVFISLNDTIIKLLSDTYPLHQIVFIRSAIGIFFSLFLVKLEGGWNILKTKRPFLHLLRCLLLIIANIAYFTALVVLPLANAAAIFFVAPLLITIFSVPLLGEAVGKRRIIAVIFGFIGVVIIIRPFNFSQENLYLLAYFLPVLSALCYALMQILTRKLGIVSKASAMAVYLQLVFIAVGFIFWFLFGDGSYATNFQNPSMFFLLRAWEWPSHSDWPFLILIGIFSSVVSYVITQAYRLASASFVAPFEYIALPLAALWGWLIFDDIPDGWAIFGMLIIVGSGLYVYQREKITKSP